MMNDGSANAVQCLAWGGIRGTKGFQPILKVTSHASNLQIWCSQLRSMVSSSSRYTKRFIRGYEFSLLLLHFYCLCKLIARGLRGHHTIFVLRML